jgi:hypothetical protein
MAGIAASSCAGPASFPLSLQRLLSGASGDLHFWFDEPSVRAEQPVRAGQPARAAQLVHAEPDERQPLPEPQLAGPQRQLQPAGHVSSWLAAAARWLAELTQRLWAGIRPLPLAGQGRASSLHWVGMPVPTLAL